MGRTDFVGIILGVISDCVRCRRVVVGAAMAGSVVTLGADGDV